MPNFNLSFYKPFFLFIFIIVFNPFKSNGQFTTVNSSYVVKIDSLTRQPDKPIPFDQPFTVVLNPRNPQAVKNVLAVPIIGRNSNFQPVYNLGASNIIRSVRIAGSQVVIEFPAIPANFTFDLYLKRKLDSTNLNTFLNFAGNVVNNTLNPGDYTALELSTLDYNYYYFMDGLSETYIPVNSPSQRIATFQYAYLFNNSCVAEIVGPHTAAKLAACNNRSLDSYLNNPAVLNATVRGYISNIIATSPAIIAYPGVSFLDDLQKLAKVYSTLKLNDQTISAIIRIWNTHHETDFFNGLISTDFQNGTKPVKRGDIFLRQKNFQTNYQRIVALQDTVQRIINEYANMPAYLTITPADFKNILIYLDDINNKLSLANGNINHTMLQAMDYFSSTEEFISTEYYVNNTDGFKDLTSVSGNIFSPQIGLSFLGVSKNEGGYQVIPKFTLGVNFNLKPINKSLVRNNIPHKDLRNYISGFVGLTFGGFQDSQYSNLLASNSLVFGLNYRVNRPFYFSLGSSVFRQQNKNPIINKYHTQFGLYASLLLDIDFTNAASSVTSFLIK